jgi:hypothetical protein
VPTNVNGEVVAGERLPEGGLVALQTHGNVKTARPQKRIGRGTRRDNFFIGTPNKGTRLKFKIRAKPLVFDSGIALGTDAILFGATSLSVTWHTRVLSNMSVSWSRPNTET